MTTVAMSSAGPVRTRCPVNSLPCRNSTSCYRRLWACDGIRDCPLADDELGCYHNTNKTVEKETKGGSGGGGGDNPYSLELGFLIFVMAGGLLFLLFLWWLCNISVHRRGHRSVGCMEALVADLKDRTWKSDLYDPDEFSEDHSHHRDLRGRDAVMEEGHQPRSLLCSHLRSPRRAEPQDSSFRYTDASQDDFVSVDEVGLFGSPQIRLPCRSPPHALNISRPPSYNSCLNVGGTPAPVIINPVRRSSNVIGDDAEDVSEGEEKAGRPGSVSREDSSSDLLPSYDEVTREGGALPAHPERPPKYPPAYQEVMESE